MDSQCPTPSRKIAPWKNNLGLDGFKIPPILKPNLANRCPGEITTSAWRQLASRQIGAVWLLVHRAVVSPTGM